MVDAIPSNSLLAALANQFASARQGRNNGSGSTIPGLQAGVPGVSETAPSAPSANPAVPSSAGGGIPGTATTGPGVVNSLLSGQNLTDPVTQSVLRSAREPGERGDLGGGLIGGNAAGVLSILSGGITAFPALLAGLVASDALGLPPDPNFFSANSLVNLVTDRGQSTQDLFEESVRRGAEFGGTIDSEGRITGDFGTTRTSATPLASFPSFRIGPAPRDRSENDRGSGGRVSQADRVRSSSNREAGGGFTV